MFEVEVGRGATEALLWCWNLRFLKCLVLCLVMLLFEVFKGFGLAVGRGVTEAQVWHMLEVSGVIGGWARCHGGLVVVLDFEVVQGI